MATFTPDPVPQEFEWTTQWKTNLSNLVKKLVAFATNVESDSVQTDSLVVNGNVYVDGAVEIEEDLSAEDAAFSGNVNIGEDLNVGGMIDGENSPVIFWNVAASSGTVVNFPPIPSWARKITVTFVAVSLSGTDNFLIQMGPNSTLETSGYVSASANASNAAAGDLVLSTAGFIIRANVAASSVTCFYEFLLHNPTTNQWVGGGTQYRIGTSRTGEHSGHKAFAGAINKISVIADGTDTFDGAGTITVRCEY